jgi:hypothetical protein
MKDVNKNRITEYYAEEYYPFYYLDRTLFVINLSFEDFFNKHKFRPNVIIAEYTDSKFVYINIKDDIWLCSMGYGEYKNNNNFNYLLKSEQVAGNINFDCDSKATIELLFYDTDMYRGNLKVMLNGKPKYKVKLKPINKTNENN